MKEDLPGGSGLGAPEPPKDKCIFAQGLGRPWRQMILRRQVTGDKTFQGLARLTIEEIETFHQNPLSG